MDKVKIGDVSAAAFKEFLQFFYFGQVKLTMGNVAAVMNLGEKYNVAECLAVCSKFLKNNLCEDNVCRHYGLAILFNQHELKKACETVIGLNTTAVFHSNGFLTCDRKLLAEILKLDWMSCTEIELFEACMSWVKATGKQDNLTKELVQTQLGQLFYEIRFGSMALDEFTALVPTNGQLFTNTEYTDIIQSITNKEFNAAMFNGNREKRCDLDPWNEKNEIKCIRFSSLRYSTKPYFLKNLETTKFTTNEPLLLKSIGLDVIKRYSSGKYINCEDVPTAITIVEVSGSDDFKKEVDKYNGKANMKSSDFISVKMPKPILVKPGFMYEFRLKQNPPKYCAIGGLLKSEVQVDNGITIQFHDDPLIPDDITSTGLIYKLRF
ncbi:BTB/POZ domain-containing protein 6-B-like [Sitodiplosis mosellana]|uniref:BTB/POZ domain-containing protein 6-B-like n=1 Tax=Sitodiplosis mosellana TaxID=263140 RepID=UPI002444AE45|nr:BTB/POZ domain-containing protein 6-B-like [Sitodiplosis mosellana]